MKMNEAIKAGEGERDSYSSFYPSLPRLYKKWPFTLKFKSLCAGYLPPG